MRRVTKFLMYARLVASNRLKIAIITAGQRAKEQNFDEVPQLYINPQECVDCSACVPVCSVTAICVLEDLPEKWANYTQINVDYFKPVDSSRPAGRA